jgi:hypothetical protein
VADGLVGEALHSGLIKEGRQEFEEMQLVSFFLYRLFNTIESVLFSNMDLISSRNWLSAVR